MQEGSIVSYRNRSNEAIHHLARSLASAPALPEDCCGHLEVDGLRLQRGAAGHKSSKFSQLKIVARSCEEFHDDGFTGQYFTFKQLTNMFAGGAPRVAQELHPS